MLSRLIKHSSCFTILMRSSVFFIFSGKNSREIPCAKIHAPTRSPVIFAVFLSLVLVSMISFPELAEMSESLLDVGKIIDYLRVAMRARKVTLNEYLHI